jgi:hypothetical protein
LVAGSARIRSPSSFCTVKSIMSGLAPASARDAIMREAELYGRFPNTRRGEPAPNAAFQVFIKSPSTSVKPLHVAYIPFKYLQSPRSISKAVTRAPAERIEPVMAPSPGPISHTESPGSVPNAESILLRAPGFMRKFCPHRFLSEIPIVSRASLIAVGES